MPRPDNTPIAPPLTLQESAVRVELHRHVEALAGGIGVRHDMRQGSIEAAVAYVRNAFEQLGQTVTADAYNTPAGDAQNLVVEWPGASKPDQVVILGAHYDTFHQTPGADDNASAVAMMLSVCKSLAGRRFRRTLRFVAFANEEPPHSRTPTMGSVVYAGRCRERRDKIHAMVCLEMVGYYDTSPGSQTYPKQLPRALQRFLRPTGDFVAFVSDLKTRRKLRRFTRAFRKRADFPAIAAPLPRAREVMWVSDHAPFWDVGYPALMVTDTSYYRNPHYHQPTDTPGTLDYDRMARVAAGVAGAVAALAGGGEPVA